MRACGVVLEGRGQDFAAQEAESFGRVGLNVVPLGCTGWVLDGPPGHGSYPGVGFKGATL